MARLPCLATRAPAPAAMKAAQVLTLKEPLSSPPVPQVSSRSPSISTWLLFSRMTRAMPVISSAVSPFMRRAVTNAANWAGVAAPVISCSMQAAAWGSVRSRRSTSRAMPSRMVKSVMVAHDITPASPGSS